MRRSALSFAVCIGMILVCEGVLAREIHVSKAGNDSASGNEAQPYLTINQAASVAQSGADRQGQTGNKSR